MDQNDARSDLAHIRSLMERSTRFISLSGLSGVFAGTVALVGAWVAQHHVSYYTGPGADRLTYDLVRSDESYDGMRIALLLDAMVVLAVALSGAFWFTWRRSKRMGQGLWDPNARRLALNLFIPLAAGGLVCLAVKIGRASCRERV